MKSWLHKPVIDASAVVAWLLISFIRALFGYTVFHMSTSTKMIYDIQHHDRIALDVAVGERLI
jgi:hypothetical protein